MSDWISVGNIIINVDSIDYVEQIDSQGVKTLRIHMAARQLEITESMAVDLWTYLMSQKISMFDPANTDTRF